MEIDAVEIEEDNLARRIFLVSESPEQLKGTHALKFIKWGAREGFDEGSTVQGRVRTGRNWYDITTQRRGQLFFPKSQQYRHIIPVNSKHLICNCNLYDVYVRVGINPEQLAAILNSTIVALNKHQFGRLMGREGNLKTEVVDVNMMLVPDPRFATTSVRRRLESAFNSMRQRKALPLVDVDSTGTDWTGELIFDDRQKLDDAVLELIGISGKQEREILLAELYEEVTTLYRQIRAAEREMQHHRSATARQGRATAQSIAAEIWESLDTRPAYRTPLDFVPPRVRAETINLPVEGRARIVPRDMFHPDSLQIGSTIIELGDPVRCEFVKELFRIGVNGNIPVPVQPEHCFNALREHQTYTNETNETFQGFAAAYTAEEAMQERVIKELWRKLKG